MPSLEPSQGEKSLLGVLQTSLDRFSPTQRTIAQFLLTRFDEAVFLTAAGLAKRIGTSEASVVRFARSLGYGGFPEFREDLQVHFREKVRPIDRMERGPGIPRKPEAILDRVIEQAQNNIRETRKQLDASALEAAARALAGATARYVLGLNASVSVAELLGHHLRKMLPNVRVLTEGGPILFDETLSVGAGDAVVAFSYPRYAKWTGEVVRHAKTRKATTIAVTDSRLAPVGQIADITLVARADSLSFGCSYVAPMLVVDALVSAILTVSGKAVRARLDGIDVLLYAHDFFLADHPHSLRDGRGLG